MISIIICARKPQIAPELDENIRSTIGVDHEVIWIDNSENRYSIFTAYNEGVSRSRYPFLVFMHDDVLYHTHNWGELLIRHFEDEGVGAIGVAGTPYMSYTPGGWWSTGVGYLHLLQSERKGDEPFLQNFFPSGINTVEAVALDGVWFCIRKKLFETIRFDSEHFNSFHFYDVDTTLQVFRAGYKLLCVKDILIHHLSMGQLDSKWLDNAMIFHQKWKEQLPISVRAYSLGEQSHIEYRVLNELMSKQAENGERPSRIYGSGLGRLLRSPRSLRYFKTPVWGLKLLGKYLISFIAR